MTGRPALHARLSSFNMQDRSPLSPITRAQSGERKHKQKFQPPSAFVKRAKKSAGGPKATSYIRDVMCLPQEWCHDEGHISIPRLDRRKTLASAGLIGKVEFNSDMSPEEVKSVICNAFAIPMGVSERDIEEGRLFPFKYLQRIGAGSRTLHVPATSSSITWNGRQVATLAKSSGMIYIMAESTLASMDDKMNIGDSTLSSDEDLPEVRYGYSYPMLDDSRYGK